jgi:hypothetical protein
MEAYVRETGIKDHINEYVTGVHEPSWTDRSGRALETQLTEFIGALVQSAKEFRGREEQRRKQDATNRENERLRHEAGIQQRKLFEGLDTHGCAYWH